MGDEELFSPPMDDQEPERSGRGFLSENVIRLLKWAAAGVAIIIVAGGTAAITYQTLGRGRSVTNLSTVSPEYEAKPDALEYFDGVELIRGVTSDEDPEIFSLQISLGYKFGDRNFNEELLNRNRQIQNIVFKHVSSKKAAELRPVNYENLQSELMEKINRVMKTGRVQEVVFREFVAAP